jgi:hypothetical protein
MMLFEVFRAAFTACLHTMFGLDYSPAGGNIDDDKVRDYFIHNGGNATQAALAFGQKHDLTRIDKVAG